MSKVVVAQSTVSEGEREKVQKMCRGAHWEHISERIFRNIV